ncbi:hypothetical protein NDU88_005901 [Pleurodeles waltl]|uniref:Uncharacterized protein n=1 Tax=Pleurodeles waltl TaxID=8319 RepID=A0AAV7ULG3_PLEWA|nr:hypothetical protein NDU88_005901 [Pleurodeles waltl]
MGESIEVRTNPVCPSSQQELAWWLGGSRGSRMGQAQERGAQDCGGAMRSWASKGVPGTPTICPDRHGRVL